MQCINKLYLYVPLNWVLIVSGNGLWPVGRQSITSTNDDLLSTGLLEINFNAHFYRIQKNSLKRIWNNRLKMPTILSRH